MRVPPHVEPIEDVSARSFVLALLSATTVIVAVALEVAGGAAANGSSSSPLARLVPLTWPQPVRAAWWVFVAVAALTFRLSLRRLGFRQRPWIIVASVVPFLAFGAGVAAGADWATWH